MTEPISALPPLAYYDNSRDPWLPMVRLMAIAAIAQAGLVILMNLIRMLTMASSFYFPSRNMSYGTWDSLVFDLPGFAGAIIMLIGAILSMRVVTGGRRTLLVGIAIYIPAVLLSGMVTFVQYEMKGYFTRYGVAFASTQLTSVSFYAVQRCLLPALVWVFFRRGPVEELFATTNR
jgi:hypothetical protein